MIRLNKFSLGLSLLACGSAFSATHYNNSRFSVGLQGAAAVVSANMQSTFVLYDEFYDTHNPDGDITINSHLSGSKVVGFFGANMQYHWQGANNSSWALDLSANQAAGSVTITNYIPEVESSITFYGFEKITPEQQYNLMLEWKHPVTNHLNFLLGAGVSALRTKSNLTTKQIRDLSDPADVNIISQSERKTLFGAGIRTGFELMLDAHSSVTANLDYFGYGYKKLTNSPELGNSEETDDSFCFINRKVKMHLVTLSVGYSHYF